MLNSTHHLSAAAATGDAATRQRTSTLRRSCEACRAVKARCVVDLTDSPDQPRCCKRCMNQGLKCVFENALARPKKLRYSARTRVKDVEEKLDGLIAMISARKEAAANQEADSSPEQALPTAPTPAPAPTSALPSAATPAPVFSAPSQTWDISGLQPPGFAFPAPVQVDMSFDDFTYLAPPPPPPPADPSPAVTSTSIGDVIDRGFLTEDAAQILLTDFIANAEQQFPFVLLPPFVTLSSMRRDRPFLLAAILTAASDVPVQAKLEVEFRKSLAQSMIVESKKNLDIVQGLLVFCMWNHRYCRPFDSQLYQLSQIAVTMAVDLELHNTFSNESSLCPSKQRLGTKHTATNQYLDDIEQARTYIGTYCMSSTVAMAHRKPTHLKFDRRIDQISRQLANAQEARSDMVLLPYHVRIRKLLEDVDRVFSIHDPIVSATMDERYIETMVQDFERQYNEIKDSLPQEAWNNTALKCSVLSLPVSIYEVGLRVPAGHQSVLRASPSNPCCEWCTSSKRLSIIVKCIRAAQSYIETYLALPNEIFRQTTIVEVSRHIDSFLILTRAGMGFDTKQFQVANAAAGQVNLMELAQLGKYLEMSEQKMASLSTLVPRADGGMGQDEKHDVFWKLRTIFRFSLYWYRKHVTKGSLDAPEHICELDPRESAKLNSSSMFWLSEGSAMSKASCEIVNFHNLNMDADGKEMDKLMMKLKECTEAMRAEAGGDAMCSPDSETTTNRTSASGSASAASTAMSASTAASETGFAPQETVDFGSTASWVPENAADLWDSLPQSSSMSPWFNL